MDLNHSIVELIIGHEVMETLSYLTLLFAQSMLVEVVFHIHLCDISLVFFKFNDLIEIVNAKMIFLYKDLNNKSSEALQNLLVLFMLLFNNFLIKFFVAFEKERNRASSSEEIHRLFASLLSVVVAKFEINLVRVALLIKLLALNQDIVYPVS